jgi:putative sigma-54 modulation protein
MQVHLTARHIELTAPLADYVEKRLERVARHFSATVRAHVILEVQKNRHIAEIVLHASGLPDFRAKGESADLYAAVDLVVEKLHKHMARQKDKRVRGRRSVKSLRLVPAPEDLPLLSVDGAAPAEDAAPRVTRVSRFIPHDMTVAEAVEELEARKHGFTVFLNDDQLSILYKRQDGTYALLEPNLS